MPLVESTWMAKSVEMMVRLLQVGVVSKVFNEKTQQRGQQVQGQATGKDLAF